MKIIKERVWGLLLLLFVFFAMNSCSLSTKKSIKMDEAQNKYIKGSYGYDLQFLAQNNIDFVELADTTTRARLVLVPAYQGRVMTSTAEGLNGNSFGWLNYDLINSGEINNKFNPVGGEERLWLGPEGGPYSIYFDQDVEQSFDNWRVPALIDTDTFEIFEKSSSSVIFFKNATVKNASGTTHSLNLKRTVSLLTKKDISEILGVDALPMSLKSIAYKSTNTIQNIGSSAWTKESGLLSIWMLSMFNPTESTVVFLPYNMNAPGKVVKDDYFGKMPAERLKIVDSTIFFKIDGKYRSKIGVPYPRAKNLCGSYDYINKILTLVWFSLPNSPKPYVNSHWGHQEDSYNGDVINSYNDGPLEDGSIMGPFYEIETSSPGAELKPTESMEHTQCVMHFRGEEDELENLISELFKLKTEELKTLFQ